MNAEHNAAIVKDLGSHLQQQIGEVVKRQLSIASRVLEPGDIALIFVEAAVSMTISAAATVSATVDESRSVEFFDWTLEKIGRLAALQRERSLAEVVRAKTARSDQRTAATAVGAAAAKGAPATAGASVS